MTYPGRYIRLLVVGILLLCMKYAHSQTHPWLVGFSERDITPIDTIWLAGYAAREEPLGGVLHKIRAKAMAVKDSMGNLGLLVATDLLGFPKQISDEIRSKIQSRWNLDRSQIILNSSHTHSAPVLNHALTDIYPIEGEEILRISNYSRKLVDDVLEMVDESINRMEPSRISAGLGYTRFQVNRRNNDEKKVHLQDEIRGPHDAAVSVLKISNEQDELTGIVFSYACHPTVLDTNLVSGDYPGFAQLELEKDHPGVTTLFIQGAGGDQNPMPRRTIPLARQYGRTLAAAVDRVLEESMTYLAASLESTYSEIPLDLNAPPTVQQLTTHCEVATAYLKRWGERLLKETDQGMDMARQYPYPVQVWKMGDQMMVALGGELVSGYALHLKKLFGHQIFVFGYCNDVMSYIPTAQILTEGGYEGRFSQSVYGLPSTWSMTIEVEIIAEVIRQAKQLDFATTSYPLWLSEDEGQRKEKEEDEDEEEDKK